MLTPERDGGRVPDETRPAALTVSTGNQFTAQPVPLSGALRELLESLSEDQLRHIIASKRARSVRAIVRRSLTHLDAEALADMILSGQRPTIGWWKRHSQPPVRMTCTADEIRARFADARQSMARGAA